MVKLYPYQKKIVNLALEIKNKKVFIAEAPTGSGKTIMINYIANMIAKNKKVIISTSTNQLAIELYNTYKEKFDKNKYDVIVGKNNYLDISKIDLLDEKYMQIKKYIKTTLNNPNKKNYHFILDVLIENAIKIYNLNIDNDEKNYIISILSSNENKEISKYKDNDISFTNHYFLLSSLLKKSLEEYVIIFDEIHLLNEVAEIIFSNSFSLFNFLNISKQLYKVMLDTSEKGLKTKQKSMDNLIEKIKYLLEKYTNPELSGIIVQDEKNIKEIIDKLENTFNKNDIKKLIEKLKNFVPKNDFRLKELINLFINEINFFYSLQGKDIVLLYSDVKGFPKLSATKKDYMLYLTKIWNKMDEVIGLSATIEINNSPNFVINRIGLGLNKNKKYFFYKLKPIFNKEQMKVFIVNKEFPKPDSNEINVSNEWAKEIAKTVSNTYDNKNSMVLLGGFKEVDAVYSELKKLLKDGNILKAQKGKNAYTMINQFKKNGGIFIATRNYGTGVDLKGELLEKLYIGKLPYPVIGSKKYNDLKNKNQKIFFLTIENEMLLNLKQWKGRLIRTKDDKGELYLLDSRIYTNSNRLNKIKQILDNKISIVE